MFNFFYSCRAWRDLTFEVPVSNYGEQTACNTALRLITCNANVLFDRDFYDLPFANVIAFRNCPNVQS